MKITNMLEELNNNRIDRNKWVTRIINALAHIVLVQRVTILQPNAHQRTLNFRLFDASDQTIAKFSMSFMPGCKGVLILHRMEVETPFRRQGMAKVLMSLKCQMAKELGASLLMCTVTADNVAQNRLMQDVYQWHWENSFTNGRTGNKVYMYTKKL